MKRSLSRAALDGELADLGQWSAKVQAKLNGVPGLEGVDPSQLAELAHWYRYVAPDEKLPYSGLVVAGYGDEEIFPAYRLCHIYGHVGNEMFWTEGKADQITHASSSLIVPLAQTSMIDLFTRGFGISLWNIVRETGRSAMDGILADCKGLGLTLTPAQEEAIVGKFHEQFMDEWIRKNWEKNYTPLVNVLSTLSVEEMAHLAETLLVLESLKERVTTSSEEVGGPIDVAAITKAEGLVWLKRKHFFSAEANLRYAVRLRHSMNLEGA